METQNLLSQLKLKFEQSVTDNDKNLSKLTKSLQDTNELYGKAKGIRHLVV
jgi:hypothetical protein